MNGVRVCVRVRFCLCACARVRTIVFLRVCNYIRVFGQQGEAERERLRAHEYSMAGEITARGRERRQEEGGGRTPTWPIGDGRPVHAQMASKQASKQTPLPCFCVVLISCVTPFLLAGWRGCVT